MTVALGDAGQGPAHRSHTGQGSNRVFGLTLGLAILAHAFVILGVRIEPPRPERRGISTVEVVVLHQPGPQAAVADQVAAPAQSTQSGSGEGWVDATTRQEEVDRSPGTVRDEAAIPSLDEPTSEEVKPQPLAVPEPVAEPIDAPMPEPAPQPDPVPDPEPPGAELQRPPEAPVLTAEPLLPEAPSLPARPLAGPTAPAVSAAQILASRNLEVARLSARIDEQTGVFANRPRRTSVSSSTKEYKYANYLEGWRRKVEQIGNLNYPEEARRKHLYGNLILRVAVHADGSIEQTQVLRSSGFKVLDEAAIHIVELAAPYAPFPPDIAAETDILDITRTWQFQRNNKLGWGN